MLLPMNLLTHGVNMVYVIINIFITAMPIRFIHVIYMVLYVTVFCAFSAVYQLVFHQDAVYDVIDWNSPTWRRSIMFSSELLAAWLLGLFWQFWQNLGSYSIAYVLVHVSGKMGTNRYQKLVENKLVSKTDQTTIIGCEFQMWSLGTEQCNFSVTFS